MDFERTTVQPRYVYDYQGEVRAAAAERAELLIGAAKRLPRPQRLMVLFELEDWPPEKIQRFLGMSKSTYYRNRSEALEQMRALLAEKGITESWQVL
jgi:DNA-directed RNA polymerase specialized sigma24 family protein